MELSRPIILMFGAIILACFVVSLYFLRFYRDTRERLFLFFSAAFGLEGINRILLAMSENPSEGDPRLYLLRAFGYTLIIVGIIDKNRRIAG